MKLSISSPSSKLSKGASSKRGFALISTVAIMVLLVMVVMGMLALSRSEVKKAKLDEHQLVAQANARMALTIALGKLQESAGSDLRSTSYPTEAILGSSPIEEKERIVGVFSTEQYDSESSALSWNSRVRDSFQSWLVSGEGTSDLDFASSSYSGDTVKLSPINQNTDQSLRAPLVEISSDDGKTGGYAWAVTGLSQTASANLTTTGSEETEHMAPSRYQIDSVASDRGIDWFPQEDEDLAKLVTFKSAEIFSGDNEGLNNETDWLNNTHYSVLSNPLDGGLKKDLTVALGENNISNELGERIFPSAQNRNSSGSESDPGGPRWEQAASYFQSSSADTLPIRPQTDTQMGFYPVIAGFTEFYGCSNTQGYSLTPTYNSGRHILTMHMAPVVKLWNPYNRPLALSDYTLAVGTVNPQYDDSNTSGEFEGLSTNSDGMKCIWIDNGSLKFTRYAPLAMRFEHRYVIKDVTLQPGQAKVYSLQDNNVFANPISGSAYTPAGGKSVGSQVDVKGSGFLLAELKEGAPRGYSIWDIHFTERDLKESDNIVYGNGRCGFHSTDNYPEIIDGVNKNEFTSIKKNSNNLFIFDSRNSNYAFKVEMGDAVNWGLKLYQGIVPKPASGSSDPAVRPLVSIKNINVSAKKRDGSAVVSYQNNIVEFPSPESGFFFATDDTYLTSTFARRMSLQALSNQGDLEIDLYNAGQNLTKKSRFLADFNPRSPTIGLWPTEYTKRKLKTDERAYFLGEALTVDGSTTPEEQPTLGTPGVYNSGLIHDFVATGLSLNDVTPKTFIGFSDDTGNDRSILFEVPDTSKPESRLFSVGQLRHCNFTIENGDYDSQLTAGFGTEDYFSDSNRSAYMIGESFADPRLGTQSFDSGKYRQMSIIDGEAAATSTHYDMSWYMNRHLWDSYFFSAFNGAKNSGSSTQASFNPRIKTTTNGRLDDSKTAIHLNAANCYMAGTFNINSTSEEAWAAFLMSTMGAKVGEHTTNDNSVPFARVAAPLDDSVDSSFDPSEFEIYSGFRTISDSEAKELAEKIVEQVKERGPFYSVSDFINRSTMDGAPTEFRIKGALQAAIDNTKLNKMFDDYQIEKGTAGSGHDPDIYQGHTAVGVPGYLTQGDICARLGHLMTARSDTFKITAYGESVDSSGRVKAQAWCEAEVQRTPHYIDSEDSDDTKFDELKSELNKTFGRKFKIVSFRWISPNELRNL